jgi:hypothetical protein
MLLAKSSKNSNDQPSSLIKKAQFLNCVNQTSPILNYVKLNLNCKHSVDLPSEQKVGKCALKPLHREDGKAMVATFPAWSFN